MIEKRNKLATSVFWINNAKGIQPRCFATHELAKTGKR
jgi:hypothetical protein